LTITAIDQKSALVLIDLQKGIVSRPTAHPANDIVSRANSLARAFRDQRLPVVLVNVTGAPSGRTEQSLAGERPADWAEFAAELERSPEDHVVTKRTWGAFRNTDLESFLKGRGVTQVVVAGIATSFGVESTARGAHEAGFNVTLATDAMTDMSLDAHNNSITRIFPRLGETGTSEEIIALLNHAP
jgi:nicotinamidase-related amidase